jgi:2,3-bisphosphoglycerate-independent phosphoglycerate mutase
MSLGIDVIEAEGATGNYRTALHAKAAAACAALAGSGYTFSFVHVKAVDDTGHDRLTALKACTLLSGMSQQACSHVVLARGCRA